MRKAPILLTVACLVTGAAAVGVARAAEPQDLSIKVVDGVVQVTDAGSDSGYVFVLSDYKIILDSDTGGYDVGPGCQRGDGQVEHPGYNHTDEYVVCPGWNHQVIRGDMGDGWDYIDQRSAPATLRSEFDLGADDDYYYGGPGDDIVHGGAGPDELSGGGGHDQLYGDGDEDYFDVGTGSATVAGGEGWDYVDYADATRGITANVNEVSGTVSHGMTDQLTSIEGMSDSKYNDKLTVGGTGADNLFWVSTTAGYDAVWSHGFADINSDNSQRDQIRAHQQDGRRQPGVFDQVTCVDRRPSRLEVDRTVDYLDNCSAQNTRARARAAQAPALAQESKAEAKARRQHS